MALFDPRRKKSAAARKDVAAVELSPEVLRAQLLKALDHEDAARLSKLITTHRATIEKSFEAWMRVPKNLADDPPAMDRYVRCMVLVAQGFQQQFNDARLIDRIAGSAAENPIVLWEQAINAARQLESNLDYEAATQVLTRLLVDLRGLRVRGEFSYKAIAHGQLARCLFASGNVVDAKSQLEQALEESREQKDNQGIGAALQGLYDVHWYLGHPKEATEAATQYADFAQSHGKTEEADRWRARAGIDRTKEPLNRVVVSVDGGSYIELDDVSTALEGKGLKFAFMRNRPSLALCEGLVARGIHRAGEGQFEQALVDFSAAAKVDPHDPNPHYQEAAALMSLGRYGEAVAAYDRTEQLAPGWFQCRAERWLAAEIAAGRVDPSVFAVMRTEELPEEKMSVEQKLEAVESAMSTDIAALPMLGLYRGRSLVHLKRKEEAAAVFADALKSSTEPDVRTRLLFELQRAIDDTAEQHRLLSEAAALNGNLIAGAMARVSLLYFID